MKNTIAERLDAMFNVQKCPTCGKSFIIQTSEWVYKTSSGKYCCSYKCMNANKEKSKPDKRFKYYDLYDNDKLIEENVTISDLFLKGYKVDLMLKASYQGKKYASRYRLERR